MGKDTFKIVTGVIFPPLGVYYGLRQVMPAEWAGLLVGGPLGFSSAPALEALMAGKPGLPNLGLGGGELESSPTYGYQGIRNSTRIGSPIGVVYGSHRVGGQLVGMSVTSEGDNDILQMLLALSEGPIQGISSIQINGQPAASYQDVTTDTRLGSSAQSAITLFGDASRSTFSADATLTDSFLTYTTNGTNLTAFEIKLTWPGGLYSIADSGGFSARSVSIEVDYKLTGAGGWTTGPRQTFTDAKRTAIRRLIRVDGLAAGQYDIRVRRTDPQASSSRAQDEVHREAINEIVNDQYRYPCVALLAVLARATDQLSGGLPTVTAVVQGRIIRVFSAVGTYTWTFSNNPAWVVFDILTNPRYGMGRYVWPAIAATAGTLAVTNGSAAVVGTGTAFTALHRGDKLVIDAVGRVITVQSVTDDTHLTASANWTGSTASGLAYEAHRNDLDIQSFLDWAAYCDELVPNAAGGTEKRALCDVVLDAESGLWDTVIRICGLGHANPVKMGNHIAIHIERAASPVQLFTMSNIVQGSFKETFVSLKERANLIEAQFLNEANGYEQDTIVIEDALITTNAEPVRKRAVSYYGATRSTQVLRLTRRLQKSNRYITRAIQFAVGIDAINCEPGDVILFQHDVPGWGFGSRCAAGSTANTVVLDKPVTLVVGKTYEIVVRHGNDTRETKTVTNTPGTYTTLTISGTWTTTPVDGELAAFGEAGISTKPFRVVGISREEDMHGTIQAIEYSASVYDDSAVPAVGGVPQYSTLPDLSGIPPHVTDLVLSQLDDASNTLWVSFNPPVDVRYRTASIYRTDSGRNVLLGESAEGSFLIPGIPSGTFVSIAVVAVGVNRAQADLVTAPTASITVHAGVLPPDVTVLELAGQGNDTNFVGRNANFRWRDRARTSGIGLQPLGQEGLGAGAGGTDSFFRTYRVEIYSADGVTLRRRDYVIDPAYTYTYEKNHEDGLALGSTATRSFLIKVWQQDSFNQLSNLPAMLIVSNASPSVPNNVTALAVGAAIRLRWDPSSEIDVAGYRVHRSTSPGFTPDASNLLYDGPDTWVDFNDVTLGTTYYFRVAAYDSFGATGLTYAGEVTAAGAGIAVSQVVGSIAANVGLVQLPAGSWTNNSPVAGSVAWSGMTVKLNGTSYTITNGNTANKWIYWTAGNTTFSTSASAFPALTNSDYLIAWNDGGTLRTLWNNWLKSGLIVGDLLAASNIITATAQIGDGLITNAKINDLDAAKITAGTLAAARLSAAVAYITNTAQIANAVIQTANIQDLTVTSLKIAANAVTNKAEARQVGSASVSSTSWTTIASVSITTSGGSVLVHGRLRCSGNGGSRGAQARLARGTTQLDLQTFTDQSGAFTELVALFDLDAPTAGTYTYAIQANNDGLATTFGLIDGGIWVTEYLK